MIKLLYNMMNDGIITLFFLKMYISLYSLKGVKSGVSLRERQMETKTDYHIDP